MSNSIRYNLALLSDGEKLWVWRRLLGRSQRAEADRRGINHSDYWAMEAGKTPVRTRVPVLKAIPLPERLRLARRRAGVSLNGLAADHRVSRVTILKWEAAGSQELRRYWRGAGFVGLATDTK